MNIASNNCKSRCAKCAHHVKLSEGEIACFYIVDEGHRRGCPPGDECDKFVLKTKETERDRGIVII